MLSEVRCPTRVDLAGGTIDLWPLYSLLGPCYTVNLSIDIFTGCKLLLRDDSKIKVNIMDLAFVGEYSQLDKFLTDSSRETLLVREIVKSIQPKFGFELSTYSKSPVGGGLGGSSSLVISILKNFLKVDGQEISIDNLVNWAHNIEARMLHTPTGTQDYIPAANPGLNIIEYTDQKMRIKRVNFDKKLFQDSMILVYTGRPHHSGINNWEVYKRAIDKDKNTLDCLAEVAQVSVEMASVCESQKWQRLSELFARDFEARIRLSSGFSSPEIEKLKGLCLDEGADAVKICGAGGGGCVMIWTAPLNKSKIVASVRTQGYQVLEANAFTE